MYYPVPCGEDRSQVRLKGNREMEDAAPLFYLHQPHPHPPPISATSPHYGVGGYQGEYSSKLSG